MIVSFCNIHKIIDFLFFVNRNQKLISKFILILLKKISATQMHMRTIPRKYTCKDKFTFNNLQSNILLRDLTEQSTLPFELLSDENCYTFFTYPTERTYLKAKAKMVSIPQELSVKMFSHLPIRQIATERKSKDFLQPIRKSNHTERGNFHIRKITYSTKSTANQSETYNQSGPSKQKTEEQEAVYTSSNSSKIGLGNMTRVSKTTIKRKSTTKMLIAASKKLPFSLQKNKNGKQLIKKAQQNDKKILFKQTDLFDLDLSKIIEKKQQNDMFQSQRIEDLHIIQLL